MAAIRIPVFVDCDNTMGLPDQEIDDGLTILYLLAQPQVELVGISATHGNGSVDEVMTATRSLLERVAPGLSLFRGADPSVHDSGGRGWRSGSEAAEALVEASQRYEGRLVVLGLGALSNLAGAAERDPGFFRRLAGIKVMGGYLRPLAFKREVHELNFSSDPEAAARVLSADTRLTIMSAQLCLSARFGWWHLAFHTRGPEWLRGLVRRWAEVFGRHEGRRGFYLWDLLPAAEILQPERFPEQLVRILSTPDDLTSGTLRFEPVDSGGDPLEPGIINLPGSLRRSGQFVRESARVWAKAAV